MPKLIQNSRLVTNKVHQIKNDAMVFSSCSPVYM